MEKTIVLITGANTGVGFEAVKQFYAAETSSPSRLPSPYHVLLGGRSRDKVDVAVQRVKEELGSGPTRGEVEGVVIDITSDESMRALAGWVESKFGRIDVLINNAGVELDIQYPKLGLSPREMFRLTYDTNVTGPHLLTAALAPLLLKSASPRLIFLASGTASFKLSEDDTFILNKAPEPGWPKQTFRELPAYKSSKIALNMIMRDWERLLRKDGVRVWAVNPGFLATGLGGDVEVLKKIGAEEPRLGGEILRDVVEGKYDGLQGKVISRHGKDGVQAW